MAELNRFERMLAKAGGSDSIVGAPGDPAPVPGQAIDEAQVLQAAEAPAANAPAGGAQESPSPASAQPLPGGNMIGFGWALAAAGTLVAVILVFVSLSQEGSVWNDNTAGDIQVMKQATFAIVWAVVGVVGALLAAAGHIVRGFASFRRAAA